MNPLVFQVPQQENPINLNLVMATVFLAIGFNVPSAINRVINCRFPVCFENWLQEIARWGQNRRNNTF